MTVRRGILIGALALAGCGNDHGTATAPADKAGEIDALARNLTNRADALRDDVDNREADATNSIAAASAPIANRQ